MCVCGLCLDPCAAPGSNIDLNRTSISSYFNSVTLYVSRGPSERARRRVLYSTVFNVQCDQHNDIDPACSKISSHSPVSVALTSTHSLRNTTADRGARHACQMWCSTLLVILTHPHQLQSDAAARTPRRHIRRRRPRRMRRRRRRYRCCARHVANRPRDLS